MNQNDKEQLSTADVAYGHGNDGQDDSRPQEMRQEHTADGSSPLMPDTTVTTYRERWQSIQADFVDKPQESVREADGLVAEVIQTLAKSFADQREQLEGDWSRGSEVSTEDLRQALQQYRSFFQRLLAA